MALRILAPTVCRSVPETNGMDELGMPLDRAGELEWRQRGAPFPTHKIGATSPERAPVACRGRPLRGGTDHSLDTNIRCPDDRGLTGRRIPPPPSRAGRRASAPAGATEEGKHYPWQKGAQRRRATANFTAGQWIPILDGPLLTQTQAAMELGVADSTFSAMLKQLPPSTPRYLLPQELLPDFWRLSPLLVGYFKFGCSTPNRPKTRGRNGGQRVFGEAPIPIGWKKSEKTGDEAA
jgi:hypothetical protein